MTTNHELKHAADIFDQMTNAYLLHSGQPGQEWYRHKYGKWQSQAVYAQGRPNPDGKVRGTNTEDAKERMSVTNKPGPYVQKDKGMTDYPIQKFSELKKLSGFANLKTRTEINHPSNETVPGAGRHFNCPNCAAAFDMQERGYDAIARPAKNGSNVGDVEKLFKGGKLLQPANTVTDNDISNLSKLYRTYSKIHFGKERKERAFDDFNEALTAQQMKMASSTERAIQAQGKGARGIIVVGWLDDPTFSERTTSYHAFNYKNEADGVKFYDAQSSRTEKLNGMSMSKAKNDFFLDISPQEVYLMRTDNTEPSERIMNSIYSPDRSKDLKHAAEVFDQMTNAYLMHSGQPGQEWYKHKYGKWQPQAVYAQGRPNPDAKVRGQKADESPLRTNLYKQLDKLPDGSAGYFEYRTPRMKKDDKCYFDKEDGLITFYDKDSRGYRPYWNNGFMDAVLGDATKCELTMLDRKTWKTYDDRINERKYAWDLIKSKRGLNDKPMDVNTINKQIASGELKSVGATNAKRWETSVKKAYNAAKNKPEDKLTKPVDRVFNEVDRLQKQASNNVNKEIRSQGEYSVGTLVVGNLFDRFSPERKISGSYRSYTYRYADGKVKFYEGGTDKEVKNESVFNDIDPRSVYIKKKWN